MDYELIFWILAVITGAIGFALMMARANRELYVDWAGECK